MNAPLVQTFKASNLPIVAVTVFKDCAEVVRVLTVNLRPGINEILIEDVAKTLIPETIHFDGEQNAIIQDFRFKKLKLKDGEVPQKEQEIREKLKAVQTDQQKMSGCKTALEERLSALKRMASLIPQDINEYNKDDIVKQTDVDSFEKVDLKECNKSGKEAIVRQIDVTSFERMFKFFDFYEDEHRKITERSLAIDEKIEALERQKCTLERQLSSSVNEQILSGTIILLLDCNMSSKENLEFRYQVKDATWYPSYILKATSDPKEEKHVKVIYQGNIKQATGEDWTKAKLTLSTADSYGAVTQLRDLETLHVGSGKQRTAVAEPLTTEVACSLSTDIESSNLFAAEYTGKQKLNGSAKLPFLVPSESHASLESHHSKAAIDQATTETVQALDAIFHIEREATIPSDSESHTVIITSFETKPQIIYKAIPRRSNKVFINALVTNESQLPFLEGDATVYFDKRFVSKNRMPKVDCGQKFCCSLGTDSCITLDCKPTSKSTSEMGSTAKIIRVTHSQKILVQNKKQKEKIHLLVQEYLPKSSERRIVVNLYSPKLTETNDAEDELKPGAKLNSNSNVEWSVIAEPGEAKELLLKYTIDHPADVNFYYFI